MNTTNDYQSYSQEQEKRYYAWLKLVKIRIEGLRKDFIRRHYRQQSRFVYLMAEEWESIAGDGEGTGDIEGVNRLDLMACMKELSDCEWQLVVYHYVQGLSLTEIARIQGVSVQAISRRKQRVLQRLRHQLEGCKQ